MKWNWKKIEVNLIIINLLDINKIKKNFYVAGDDVDNVNK